ncbi:unnamed protein product [Macrosiphum euphorbiae]|uniref:Ankyrin repeat-containing domain n=1 Tax=Macrosiphum euphorbiae TaxID=13131 RepID=A0AAV0XZ32_9HEMI|nr:unnamed protein product [Macrosiphum euphorbiae]
MAAANEEITYALPSLLELAYQACSRDQRKRYDELPVVTVDLQVCCESLLKIIKFNSHADRFQPRGHRRFMFAKVHPKCRLINNICEMAAFHGHINCMKFARAIGVPWYTPNVWQRSACDEAADKGHMECLVYAHANGSPWSRWTCNFAAGSGHLDCLKYCRDNGFPWDEFTCTNAAQNGRMECLVYVRQNGCPWNEDTCSMAALNGKLKCLKYCRENGCPWDSFTCEMAASTGKLDCLRYAIENGCEWDIDGYLSAFHGMKDPSCLRYALKLKHGLAKTNASTSSPDDVIPSK